MDKIAKQPVTWDLAPAPESTGHIQLEKSYGLFINGKFQAVDRRAAIRLDQSSN